MTVPETRYAKSGDVNIAYQVTGEGPIDLKKARYAAERIPGARYRELPGVDHLPRVGDRAAITDEDRGSAALKGVPGEWHLYAVER